MPYTDCPDWTALAGLPWLTALADCPETAKTDFPSDKKPCFIYRLSQQRKDKIPFSRKK
jgi:hypothetical protein